MILDVQKVQFATLYAALGKWGRLSEPYRWLVEYAVYKLAVEEPKHGRMIRKNEYAWTREGKIILDSGLIRQFLELLERIFQTERLHKFKHGIKRKYGMSMCQEITIAKIAVVNLAEFSTISIVSVSLLFAIMCSGRTSHRIFSRLSRFFLDLPVSRDLL
jgi:hypothetical protein